jgi:hypothetical protein
VEQDLFAGSIGLRFALSTRVAVLELRSGRPFALRTVMPIILIILLMLLFLGALPAWPYNSGWSYGTKGVFGLVLIIIIVFALMGRI